MREIRQLPLFESLDGREHRLTDLSPLREALVPFQAYLRREGKTDNTIINFSSDFRLMTEFLTDSIPLGRITTENLNQFLRWLEFGRGVPCSRKSYARRVTTLKVFFKWLKEDRVRRDDPALPILQRSGSAPLQHIIKPDEIEHLLNYAYTLRTAEKPDARPEMLIRLLLDTAIKKSEAMRLTPADIDRSNPYKPVLIVRRQGQKDLYKARLIDLQPDWLEVFDDYLCQYVPPNTLFTCTARNLEYVLTDTAKAAGIESRISFEILRWTSAVMSYRTGIDLETLREKMGLSKISWRETSDKIIKLAAMDAYR